MTRHQRTLPPRHLHRKETTPSRSWPRAKAIRRLVKGGNNGSGSGVFGGEEDEDSLEQPFLAAPARACQDLNIQARRFPGRFLADALSSMQRFLGSRVGAGTSSEELPRVLTYLETVFNQRYTKECVGIRTAREMRTLAEAIDSLLEGDSMRTADLLIQRFKALETSVSDGSWSLARHLELIPEEGVGLTSPAERDLIAKLELQRARLAEGGGYQEKIGGRQRHEIWVKRGSPCRESECPKGQTSNLSRRMARCLSTAHSTGAGRRGDDEKSWKCKAESKSEEEAGCGLEDEAERKGRRGRQSPSASGFGGLGTPESKGCTSARAWKGRTLPWLAKVQGVWEAGAEQQLWACADRAWSMSAFVAVAAPRLTPAALGLKVFEGMTTRDSRLGLATRGLFRTVFEAPSRERRQRDLPRLPVPWVWPPFADVVLHTVGSCRSRRRHHSRERRQCDRVTGIWCLPCSGCGHIRDLQVPRGRSTAVQFASLQQIMEGARYLLSRAPEDGALSDAQSGLCEGFYLARGSDAGCRSQRSQRHLRC